MRPMKISGSQVRANPEMRSHTDGPGGTVIFGASLASGFVGFAALGAVAALGVVVVFAGAGCALSQAVACGAQDLRASAAPGRASARASASAVRRREANLARECATTAVIQSFPSAFPEPSINPRKLRYLATEPSPDAGSAAIGGPPSRTPGRRPEPRRR